ncbi:tail completion protein [Vibrio phage vB_VpM-pA2SJ1]|uniref:Tail completion protein n=1 Tax=Vibrio phage vB_VpM-pA2SJ1 TaxID=3095964 RepID=A0AAX4J636_9CAUD
MLNYDELGEKCVSLVRLITGLDEQNVLIADQGISPEYMPKGLYATVKIVSDQNIGASGKGQQADDEEINVPGVDNAVDIVDITKRQVLLRVSINFYRQGARAYASSLQDASRRYIVSKFLWENKLGWQRTGAVNDLTDLQNAGYEERAQIDVYLYAEDIIRDIIPAIYHTSIIVEDEKGNKLNEVDV